MISVPEAGTLPITPRPVASANASTTSGGKPSGYVGMGSGVTMPISSQWPMVVSLPAERVVRRPTIDGGASAGGQPSSGMMLPSPSSCRCGSSSPPTASATWANVDDPASP